MFLKNNPMDSSIKFHGGNRRSAYRLEDVDDETFSLNVAGHPVAIHNLSSNGVAFEHDPACNTDLAEHIDTGAILPARLFITIEEACYNLELQLQVIHQEGHAYRCAFEPASQRDELILSRAITECQKHQIRTQKRLDSTPEKS